MFVVGAVSAAEGNDSKYKEDSIYKDNCIPIDNSISKNDSITTTLNTNNPITTTLNTNNPITTTLNTNNSIFKDIYSSKSKVASSKRMNLVKNKIKNIYKSKSTFKAGTSVKITVTADKSIKRVSGSISGKGNYKFKTASGKWYCYLNTNGYKTGHYIFKIKAIDKKNKIYEHSTSLTVNNAHPKVISLKTTTKKITAGTPFYLENIADKSSKKVIAVIRGKTFYFKQRLLNSNDTNKKNWTLTGKLNYKEIGDLKVSVYTYDSLGNYNKKTITIKSVPKYVYWNGTISYNRPTIAYYSNAKNTYQKSINELSKHVAVYEGYAGDSRTLGITYMGRFRTNRVVIAYKDPFVVYHEMGHVLHWDWSEYQCDLYAYQKLGYWLL